MIVPIFLYASTQQVHNYNDNTENEWMAMNNLSASLLQGITWENDTTYIWNNRSYSVPQLMNGTAEEESNSSPVSCNIYWPENEYMNGQAAFTLYTVSFVILTMCMYSFQVYIFSLYSVSLFVIHERSTLFLLKCVFYSFVSDNLLVLISLISPKFTLAFAIPLVLILVFYILVIRKLRVRIVLLYCSILRFN